MVEYQKTSQRMVKFLSFQQPIVLLSATWLKWITLYGYTLFASTFSRFRHRIAAQDKRSWCLWLDFMGQFIENLPKFLTIICFFNNFKKPIKMFNQIQYNYARKNIRYDYNHAQFAQLRMFSDMLLSCVDLMSNV